MLPFICRFRRVAILNFLQFRKLFCKTFVDGNLLVILIVDEWCNNLDTGGYLYELHKFDLGVNLVAEGQRQRPTKSNFEVQVRVDLSALCTGGRFFSFLLLSIFWLQFSNQPFVFNKSQIYIKIRVFETNKDIKIINICSQ